MKEKPNDFYIKFQKLIKLPRGRKLSNKEYDEKFLFEKINDDA